MIPLHLLASVVNFTFSDVTVTPSDDLNVAAIVTFENRSMNLSSDEGTKVLDFIHEKYGELQISVTFGFNIDGTPGTGADSIKIVAPDGFFCVPQNCEVVVMEGQTGEILLIEFTGM